MRERLLGTDWDGSGIFGFLLKYLVNSFKNTNSEKVKDE